MRLTSSAQHQRATSSVAVGCRGSRCTQVVRAAQQPYLSSSKQLPSGPLPRTPPPALRGQTPPLPPPSPSPAPSFSSSLFDLLTQQPQHQHAQPVGGAFKASGRTVVITGGSQGVGRSTALLFARKGYNVAVCARDALKLQHVANDCAEAAGRQGASLAVQCDVTDERQVKDFANQVYSRFESVDIVVNNAGVMARGAFADVPALEADRLMRTNYLGAYMVSQAFLPILTKEAQLKRGSDRPSIIMVNSFAAKVPMKHASAFSASKHALHGFTEALRSELAPLNIHVGEVHPGVVKSNLMERANFYGKNEAEERKTYRQNVRNLPISQSPQQVAEAIFAMAGSKQHETVVGAPFAAVDLTHRLTGINPMALPLSFL